MSLFSELKRRNVFKASIAYLALGWVVVEVSNTIVPMLHLPESIPIILLWIGLAGFPFVVVFSWAFELTPGGLKRESEVDRSQSITHVTGKRLDYIIIGMLAVAIGLFVLQYLRPPVARTTAEVPATASTPAAGSTAAASPAAASAPVQPAAPAPDEKSIAVLPFVNMSEEKANEYFSDGISEELLNLLAKIPELKVIARTSSFAFKDKEVDIADIAEKLNVAHVLEGSVRKSGNTVRITAQLIRTADSTHLWSETYDRPLDNIFAVQDEIAGAVVEQLKVTLLGAAPRSRVTDPKAFALFLRGRQLSEQFTPEAMRESIALLQQGLAIDPQYPEAWRKLAAVVLNEASFDLRPRQEARAEARGYIEKALQIDPDYGRGHDGLAVLAMGELDLATAARHWQRALELDPTNTDILSNFSELLAAIRPLDQAMRVDKYVIERDPVGPIGYINLAWDYVYADRLPEALEVFRTSLALSPGSLGRAGNIATVQLLMGDVQSALETARQEPLARSRLTVEACAQFRAGNTAASDAALQALEAAAGTGTDYSVATAAACRGEADRVFAALQAAVAAKDKAMVNINNEPFFASMHHDPRWLPFLRSHGLAPEQLAAIPFEVKLPRQ